MLKLIAGNDRAIAAYSRARKWTPLGTGRYADEHGGAVRRLFQSEGLWGMTPTNAKLLVLVPDDQGGVPMPSVHETKFRRHVLKTWLHSRHIAKV